MQNACQGLNGAAMDVFVPSVSGKEIYYVIKF
jgi:hypothetical protein